MAHEAMAIRFWEWGEVGPYLGMPVENFVGWSLTGVVFVALSRWAWNADLDPRAPGLAAWFPFAVYTANTVFAMALAGNVGLWVAFVLALRPPRSARAAPVGDPAWQAAPSR